MAEMAVDPTGGYDTASHWPHMRNFSLIVYPSTVSKDYKMSILHCVLYLYTYTSDS